MESTDLIRLRMAWTSADISSINSMVSVSVRAREPFSSRLEIGADAYFFQPPPHSKFTALFCKLREGTNQTENNY